MPHANGCMHFRRGDAGRDAGMGRSQLQPKGEKKDDETLGSQFEVNPDEGSNVSHG